MEVQPALGPQDLICKACWRLCICKGASTDRYLRDLECRDSRQRLSLNFALPGQYKVVAKSGLALPIQEALALEDQCQPVPSLR